MPLLTVTCVLPFAKATNHAQTCFVCERYTVSIHWTIKELSNFPLYLHTSTSSRQRRLVCFPWYAKAVWHFWPPRLIRFPYVSPFYHCPTWRRFTVLHPVGCQKYYILVPYSWSKLYAATLPMLDCIDLITVLIEYALYYTIHTVGRLKQYGL